MSMRWKRAGGHKRLSSIASPLFPSSLFSRLSFSVLVRFLRILIGILIQIIQVMRGLKTRIEALDEATVVNHIRGHSHPLAGANDIEPLMNRIGNARIVMLGEASHGTHEYYTWRTIISKRLITEKSFNCIAVEGDWPDCYRLNRFIKGYGQPHSTAFDLLHSFNRWPTWMWANWEIIGLIEWLKNYNEGRREEEKAGFHGLDVYSLWESMESIIQYLEKTDPASLEIAKEAFACFEPFGKEGSSYARATRFVPELCENEVVDLLKQIQERSSSYNSDDESVFSAEQNARIAVNAEKYYRTMIRGGAESWNIRDRHMSDTIDHLLDFYGNNSKIIVWAHNTHIGDARATDMTEDGMFNIGELARAEHAEKGVVLVGFGSYKGSVVGGRSWGAPMLKMRMPEAAPASLEYFLHEAGREDKLLFSDDFMMPLFMDNPIGHRAVGVVYNPAYERLGNYVPTILPLRYDAFIYLDETTALHPLHFQPDGNQMPETFPFGV
jgi:erythromycin esterase